jgi:signal transduction histidine kinase
MSIRLKLVLGYNLFLAALAVLGYFVYSQLDRSRDLSTDVSSRLIDRVEHASHLSQDLTPLRSLELAYILEGDPQVRRAIGDELAGIVRGIDTHAAEYEATFIEELIPPDFGQFQDDYQAYLALHDRMLALTAVDGDQDVLALYGGAIGDFQGLADIAHSLRHAAYEDAQAATSEAGSFVSRSQYILIGGLLTAALLIFAIGHPLSIYIDRRLRALLAGTDRVSRGEFDQPIAVGSRDEFGTLAQAFDSMVDSLRSARDQVSELHAQALAMQEERIGLLREQVTQVTQAQEEERQRVARELHDQAGQALTVLQLGLSRIEVAGPTPEMRQEAAALRQMAIEAMHIIRNLAMDLRPSALDELGLPAALRDYIQTFSRRTGIEAKLEVSSVRERLPAPTEVTLFRIAQEGLTNAAKHAQASRITVALAIEGHNLRLVIEDNGVGFDVERALGAEMRKSLGLIGMEERCRLLEGELLIQSRPGEGTRLAISVPYVNITEPVTQQEVLERR